MRKPFIPFIGVLLLALGLYALFVNQPSPPTTLLDNKTQTTPAPAPSTDPPNDPSTFLVTRVIDGDTIEIQERYSRNRQIRPVTPLSMGRKCLHKRFSRASRVRQK